MNTDNAKEYFQYLFELQKSGKTNMMNAWQYLKEEKGLSHTEAKETLLYWMANYDALAEEMGID